MFTFNHFHPNVLYFHRQNTIKTCKDIYRYLRKLKSNFCWQFISVPFTGPLVSHHFGSYKPGKIIGSRQKGRNSTKSVKLVWQDNMQYKKCIQYNFKFTLQSTAFFFSVYDVYSINTFSSLFTVSTPLFSFIPFSLFTESSESLFLFFFFDIFYFHVFLNTVTCLGHRLGQFQH